MKKQKVNISKLNLQKETIASLSSDSSYRIVAGGPIKTIFEKECLPPVPGTSPSRGCPCIPIDGTMASARVSNCSCPNVCH